MNRSLDTQNELLRSHLAFLMSLVLVCAFGLMIAVLPQSLDATYIKANFVPNISEFYPDGRDKTIYLVGSLIFVFSYIVFQYMIKMKLKISDNSPFIIRINQMMSITTIFLVTVLFIIGNIEHPMYVGGLLGVSHSAASSIFKIIFVSAFTMTAVRYYSLLPEQMQRIANFIFALLILGAILLIAKNYVVPSYYWSDSNEPYHFDAYFYPVYRVFSGQTPLVDFSSIYGFYPYMLTSVYVLLKQNITMYNFSIIMAGLVLVTLISLWYVVNALVKNKILVFIGLWALMYVMFVQPPTVQKFMFYLQYTPHRVVMPAIFLAFSVAYVTTKHTMKRRVLFVMGFLFSSLALFWNIDTGIAVLAGMLALHIYTAAYDYGLKDKRFYVKSIKAGLLSVAAIAFSAVMLIVLTWLRTGQLINITNALSAQTLFYKYGYYMQPMKLVHPWLTLIYVYALGITKAIRNIYDFRTEDKPINKLNSTMYFVLSIIGLGLFVYFDGRSHDFVFMAVLWPGIILAILLCQDYFERLKQRSCTDFMTRLITSTKYILSLLFITTLSAGLVLNFYHNKSQWLTAREYDISQISVRVGLIQSIKEPGEKVEMIMSHSATICSIMGEKITTKVPATIDWFAQSDLTSVLNVMRMTQDKVIFDKSSMDTLMRLRPSETKEILDSRFVKILDSELIVFALKNQQY